MLVALHYCKKCGRVVERKPNVEKKCDYCGSIVYPVPEKYWLDGLDIIITDEQERLLREELVKTAPEFDEYLFNHRDQDLQERWARVDAAIQNGKAILEGRDKGNKYGVECPYCHATNVKRITNTSKAVHTALFGIFSAGRNSRNFHCNRCNSDF